MARLPNKARRNKLALARAAGVLRASAPRRETRNEKRETTRVSGVTIGASTESDRSAEDPRRRGAVRWVLWVALAARRAGAILANK